ncbi:MAG: thiamine monophosphate synthase [Betaproteobacteria bacterium RIFCSPLOWO2_02_FULL_63_19]|nr:MAG: thiamine monophosphate synthase [Betaproteobacteria bacterium RIFCSPLOWO2_02_FULL_63_19]OGA72728.1 MAG: thiamine monophosphate synthase [Betaproteobacteria bacterium RIFCSPLOWO2_12_FULL_65_14]
MSTMTGGQALVAQLLKQDVEAIFLIPGVQLDWAVDALREQNSRISVYVPRHEQATTYMADGYARISGTPGVAMVVPGPGVLNACAGMATAYASNSPVFMIAAQIRSGGVGKAYGLLHEIKDQSRLLKSVTKWNALAQKVEDIPKLVARGFSAATEGRRRPVAVEIPHDLFEVKAEMRARRPRSGVSAPVLDERAIDEAAALLDSARLPVIYVGGGVMTGDACEQLYRLARRMHVPVVMSDNARGALPDQDPLAFTTLAGRVVFERADVVLVAGSRFMDSLVIQPSWPVDGKRYIHINIDAADFAAPRQPSVSILGDAGAALGLLAQKVKPRQVCSADALTRTKQWAEQEVDKVIPQNAYIRAMRRALPETGIFVNELTQVGYLARVAWPVSAPRTYIGPGYQGTLGYGYPTAIGAAIAAKGRPVLAISGDGGLGWNMQELATARKYELPVILVVFNDGYFGNVRALQRRQFGAEIGVELKNPDFEHLARAFDLAFQRAESPETLGEAIARGVARGGPTLIEAPVGEMPSPWPLLRLQPMAGSGAASHMNPNPFALE